MSVSHESNDMGLYRARIHEERHVSEEETIADIETVLHATDLSDLLSRIQNLESRVSNLEDSNDF